MNEGSIGALMSNQGSVPGQPRSDKGLPQRGRHRWYLEIMSGSKNLWSRTPEMSIFCASNLIDSSVISIQGILLYRLNELFFI